MQGGWHPIHALVVSNNQNKIGCPLLLLGTYLLPEEVFIVGCSTAHRATCVHPVQLLVLFLDCTIPDGLLLQVFHRLFFKKSINVCVWFKGCAPSFEEKMCRVCELEKEKEE